jgi:glucose-6-phosphate isomerase
MIPASVIGINIYKLLENAHSMRERFCKNIYGTIRNNAGNNISNIISQETSLTIIIDKLGFSLWVEQLIGESSGKEVRNNTLTGDMLEPENYGGDGYLFI